MSEKDCKNTCISNYNDYHVATSISYKSVCDDNDVVALHTLIDRQLLLSRLLIMETKTNKFVSIRFDEKQITMSDLTDMHNKIRYHYWCAMD